MDGWKTIRSFWEDLFSGTMLVSGSVLGLEMIIETNCQTLPVQSAKQRQIEEHRISIWYLTATAAKKKEGPMRNDSHKLQKTNPQEVPTCHQHPNEIKWFNPCNPNVSCLFNLSVVPSELIHPGWSKANGKDFPHWKSVDFLSWTVWISSRQLAWIMVYWFRIKENCGWLVDSGLLYLLI